MDIIIQDIFTTSLVSVYEMYSRSRLFTLCSVGMYNGKASYINIFAFIKFEVSKVVLLREILAVFPRKKNGQS